MKDLKILCDNEVPYEMEQLEILTEIVPEDLDMMEHVNAVVNTVDAGTVIFSTNEYVPQEIDFDENCGEWKNMNGVVLLNESDAIAVYQLNSPLEVSI